MKTTYTLRDTFNQIPLSRHRTVLAAARAQRKHLRAIRRANGKNSYLAYEIVSSDGADISEEICAAREQLDCR